MTTKRYTPDDFNRIAGYCEGDAETYKNFGLEDQANHDIEVAEALRQAAEDCQRLQEAVDLLAKCPKVTDDMYVGRDSEGYGKQARAFVKAHKARTQEQAK